MSRNATGALEISVDCYATFARVMEMLPLLSLNYSTRPTKLQTIVMIRESFDTLNGLIHTLGYDVPVASTNATSVNIAARLHALDAASLIEQIQYSAGNRVRSEHATALLERRNEMWKEFKEGNIELIGAARSSPYRLRKDEQQPQGQFFVVSGTEQDPVFTRDMTF